MKNLDEAWLENITLKRKNALLRAELRGHSSATQEINRTVAMALDQAGKRAGDVQRLQDTLDLVGIKWQFGGVLDVDFDALTEALGPRQSLELAVIIAEKFSNLTTLFGADSYEKNEKTR